MLLCILVKVKSFARNCRLELLANVYSKIHNGYLAKIMIYIDGENINKIMTIKYRKEKNK